MNSEMASGLNIGVLCGSSGCTEIQGPLLREEKVLPFY